MDSNLIAGKKILIVDDERDIIDSIEDLLDKCVIESAVDFDSGSALIRKNKYDAVILDIMGVDGYNLLKIANEYQIPAIILTAHALSPEDFKKSIKNGAYVYLPKEHLFSIALYLGELFEAIEYRQKKSGRWFILLGPSFEKKFGKDWKENDKPFWQDFANQFRFTREELEEIL
ncbi:MAG: response regulator transcription factor [Desulfatirhabdiaceae bacterium]